MQDTVIRLKGLTKYYGKQRGIEDLSFSVKEGEIFGFIGPNGAGKSTTIRTLMGLLHPDRGEATIFGLDCRTQAAEIAKRVGYLPGENGYYEELKVRELLQYTAELYGMDGKERMEELSERFHLDLSRKIRDLSFGNKKKVGILSALLPSPDLLILDEPTSGLDPLMQQTLYSILLEENAKGTTIFLSSHVLAEVQKLCSRVAILRDGKLIDIQSIQEIRENGYKKVTLTLQSPPVQELRHRQEIADYQEKDGRLSFLYRGHSKKLLETLQTLDLSDVLIEDPSLEEIFLHYYE